MPATAETNNQENTNTKTQKGILITRDMLKPAINTRINLGRPLEWDEMDAMLIVALILWDDTIGFENNRFAFVPVSNLKIGDFTIPKTDVATIVIVPKGMRLITQSGNVYATITNYTSHPNEEYEENGIAYVLRTDRQDCSFSLVDEKAVSIPENNTGNAETGEEYSDDGDDEET